MMYMLTALEVREIRETLEEAFETAREMDELTTMTRIGVALRMLDFAPTKPLEEVLGC